MTEAIPLNDAMPKAPDEVRDSLEPGVEPFFIKGIFMSTETRYNKDPVTGDGKLAKINGYKIIGSNGESLQVKYRTTSAPLISQLEKLLQGPACKNGSFPVPVGPVTVITEMTGNGRDKYVLVAAE